MLYSATLKKLGVAWGQSACAKYYASACAYYTNVRVVKFLIMRSAEFLRKVFAAPNLLRLCGCHWT